MSVYFIQAGEGGRIKIGYAGIPEHRISYLSRFSGPDLKTLAIIEGSARLESYLHQHVKGSHAHDEWFDPTPEVLALVKAAQELHTVRGGARQHEEIYFTPEEIEDLCKEDGVIGAMARETRRFSYNYNNHVLFQLIRLLAPPEDEK